MAEKIPPERNGNDIKTALERAEDERREREIKAIEKNLRENGGNKAKNPRTRKTGKVRHQRFSPRNEPMRDYDEDGHPAARLDTQVHSWEPEIKKEPELNRKASKKRTHKVLPAPGTPGFVQVETKSGASWTDPEPKAREPRVRQNSPVVVDAEPSVQVETKSDGAEVKSPQTVEAPKANPELSSEVSALTAAVSKLYEENVALDDDNSLRKVLDAIPDDAVRESLRSKGLKISYRDSEGKAVPSNRMGELMFVQLADDPSDEGWTFPTAPQINAVSMIGWFGASGKEIISRPVRSRLVGDTIELVDKDAITAIRRENFNKTSGNTSNSGMEVKSPQTAEAEPAPAVVAPPKPIDFSAGPIDFTFDDAQPLAAPAAGTEAIAQSPETRAEEFARRSAEVSEMLKGQNFGADEINPVEEARLYANFDRYERALEILDEAERKIKDGTYVAGTQPPEVNPAASIELTQPRAPVSAENRQVISTAEMQGVISEQLNGKAKINALEIKNTPDGLMLHAELDGGWKGGKIVLDGAIINSGNTIAVESLNIEARGYVKSMIENNLSGLSDAIKSHFEKQYGKPISGLQVGESGLTIEFGAEEQSKPAQENEPAVYRSNREKKKEGPSFEDRKKYLSGRDKELGAKAKEYGLKIEKFIRDNGEEYDRMSFKKKLLIGAVLGVGATVFSTVSTPLATAFAVNLGIQRFGGMASMYLKFEKMLQKNAPEEHKQMRNKVLAGFMSVGYTTLMSAAIGSAVHYASESSAGVAIHEKLNEWLTNMRGYSVDTQVVQPPAQTPVAELSAESAERLSKYGITGSSSPEQIETAMEQVKNDLAGARVEAIAASDALEKTKETLASAREVAVQETATMEQMTPSESREALRNAVSKITEITEEKPPSFEMPKHADFSIHEDDTTISPYDVTPTDQTPTEDILSPEVEEVEEQVEPGPTSAPEATPAEALPVEKVPEPVVSPKVEADVPQTAGNVEAPPVEVPAPPAEAPVSSVETPAPVGETPTLQVEHVKEWTNPNDVKIDPLHGHVFPGPGGVEFAYGNDFDARFSAAQDFAKANPDIPVWVQAEKLYLNPATSKMEPWVFEVRGVKGFFGTSVKLINADAPVDPRQYGTIDPNTFIKRLDK